MSATDPRPQALEAAAAAFAATRTARRLLDAAGRRGALAVNRSRPIPGARKASGKAQAKLEDSAQSLEGARERWGALMGGIATDLDISTADLAARVESHAFLAALEQLEACLAACREAAGDLDRAALEALDLAQAAVLRLRGDRESEPADPGTPGA
ncbi:MAG TPA: hypothetical protein VI138_00070 [Candidatus Dormibacteraeota bacterium]